MTSPSGEFRWLATDDLNVDFSYHRPASEEQAAQIARSWSWTLCGVLTISRRQDHSYFIIDGLARKLAADELRHVVLPCLVFDDLDVAAEAAAFIACNDRLDTPR